MQQSVRICMVQLEAEQAVGILHMSASEVVVLHSVRNVNVLTLHICLSQAKRPRDCWIPAKRIWGLKSPDPSLPVPQTATD